MDVVIPISITSFCLLHISIKINPTVAEA